ncbi:MAG TPA: alpha-2-macroglobulin [Caulobacteraceae bacterium]|jgi:hypothetical protein
MAWWNDRPLVVGAIGAVVIGFGGGFIVAKATETLHSKTESTGGGLFSMFGHPRSAHARRAGLPKPEGFAVWRQRVDTSDANAKACVEFTRPLNPQLVYSDYVLVSPDPGRPPAATVNPKNPAELCVTGIGVTDHRVTFLKGLKAKNGQTLKSNADIDFSFGVKPTYVGFAGDGVILPREDGDGVGIETVNVAKLMVEVWRVPDRNLVRKSISAPAATGEGEYPDDYGDDAVGSDGRKVWSGEVAVKGPQAERVTTVFPLGAVLHDLKPGAYVIKVKDGSGGRDLKKDGDDDSNPPAQARRWILFTDMALVSYQGADGLDVTVRSLKSARPMGGVRLALVAQDGEDLASAVSDGDGHARFARPLLDGKGGDVAKMVMAYGPGADFTTMDIARPPVDLSNQGVGGRPMDAAALTAGRSATGNVDSYVYSDRGIYRPGETVRLVALLRDLEAKAVKDRKGFIVVKRPSGVEAARWRFDGSPSGFASADFVLPKSAPRGRWSAEIDLQGVDKPAGNYSFSVEDFAPQRLAVEVAANAAQPMAPGETRNVGVDARFLYGAVGAGLKVQGEARFKADNDPFPQFKDYEWGDAASPYAEKEVDLKETVTDGAGHATLALAGDQAGDSAQPLKALFTASVFEPGGRPVREGAEIRLRDRPLYIGVKVDQPDNGGSNPLIGFDIAAVNAQGGAVAVSGVNWSLITENWDYDWFQQDGKWSWRRTSRDVIAAKGVLDIGGSGLGKLARRLEWGDYRLELTDPKTNAKTVIRFASGWGAPAKDAEAPDMVRVSSGDQKYAQGETVSIAIKAPYAGQAQVAVATDRVIELRNVYVPAGGTTVRLRSSAAWGGGAYVLVSVVQPRDPVATPKPRRAIGLTYVKLDPKDRQLAIALGAATKIRGRDQLIVPVTVKGLKFGQRAKVTIAAVDQGILNLTKFESPNPVNWYFGKRALGVDYRDDYGRLLDPNLGAPAALNYGADEIGGEGLTTTPIKTVALWSGVVETGLDGQAHIVLPAPAFNGELRVMAVAWTDRAVGQTEQKVTVREPVVAELDLPRFLAPGDKALATLELHNVEGAPGGYTAVVQGENGLLGLFRKLYQLIVGQRIAEHVAIDAPAVAGVGHVAFRVTGPNFNYPESYDLQTRVGWGPQTKVYSSLQQPGELWTPRNALLDGYAPGSATLEVSYSPFRGFDPAPIADALSKYPYGCTEQLVSTAYPYLYSTNGVAHDGVAQRAHPLLVDAVSRLLDRQSADGAFGLWRVGDGEADPWLGAYATDFLIEARAQGVPVSQDAIDKALSAMRQVSRPDGFSSISYLLTYPDWWTDDKERNKQLTQKMRSRAAAYALYDLAKAGRATGDLARLRWYHDVEFKTEESPVARAQVGAALDMMGDRARGRDSFKQAIASLGYRDVNDWYQSPLRDTAAVIALAYEAGETDLARGLQDRLENAVKDPDTLNTQEEARLLQAAHFMLAAAGQIRIDTAGVTALVNSGGAVRWGVGPLAQARFVNRGGGALWRTVTVRGEPVSAPGATSQGISIEKSYFTMQGQRVDPSHIAQGDRIVVRITGHAVSSQTLPLVIDDALPAGFEIETVLSPEDASDGPFKFLGPLSTLSAQEMRDDRYVAAMKLPGGRPFTMAYVVRAVTAGDFYLPGAEAHDMYHPGIFARTAGGRTAITPAI